jgi:hypothetical protein
MQEHVGRLLLDTDDAEEGFARVARQITAVNTAAESLARRGLAEIAVSFEDTAKAAAQSVAETAEQLAVLQDAQAQGFDPEALGLDAIDEAALRAQKAVVKFGADLTKTAEAGAINANTMQRFVTRLVELGHQGVISAEQVEHLGAELQALQIHLQNAGFASRKTATTLGGLPAVSESTSQNLTKLSSAAQGMMFATSAMQGSIQGAAFSLIFMRFAIIKLMLTVAAITAVFILAVKSIKGFVSILRVSNKAAREMTSLGQRFASFFGRTAIAVELLNQADKAARQLGVGFAEAADSFAELLKVGANTEGVRQALLDTAAATGESLQTVTDRFTETISADADKRKEVIEQFARDFNIEIKQYENAQDLISALQTRFAGSAQRAANTQEGMLNRLTETWKSLGRVIGTVVDGFIKPFITLALTFANAILDGFTAARDADRDTGRLADRMNEFRATVLRLLPMVMALGNALGRGLYRAILLVFRVTKAVISALTRFWQAMKPIRDIVVGIAQFFKEWIGRLLELVREHSGVVKAIAAIALAAVGLKLALSGFAALTTRVAAALRSLALMEAGLNGLKSKVISVTMAPIRGVLTDIATIRTNLASIGNSIITVSTRGKEGVLRDIAAIQAALNAIKSTTVDIGVKGGAGAAAGSKAALGLAQGIALGVGTLLGRLLGGAILGALAAAATVISIPVAIVAGIVLAIAAAIVAAILFPEWTGRIVGALITAFTLIFFALPILLIKFGPMIAKALADVFVSGLKLLGEIMGALFGPLIDVIRMTFGMQLLNIAKFVRQIIEGDWGGAIKTALTGLRQTFIEFPLDVARAIRSGLSKVSLEILPRVFGDIVGAIKTGLGNVAGLFGDTFGPVAEKVQNALSGLSTFAGEWGRKFVFGLRDELRPLNDHMVKPIRDAIDTIMAAIGSWDDRTGFVGGIRKALEFLTEGIKKMPNPFAPLLGFINGVAAAAETATRLIADVINAAKDIPSPADLIPNPFGGLPDPRKIFGRAHGGEIGFGSTKLVGERGPEIFRPNAAGTIIPNHRIGGGGGTTINIDLRGSTISDDRAAMKLAEMVGTQLSRRLSLAKPLSLHPLT